MVWYESHRSALDPALVLGMVEVESGFRKFAISSAGAMGVMQVMPFWTRVLGQGDATMLFQW
jgi:soluble lytic murein transglycosylase-like protein